MGSPVDVFVSYAPADEMLWKELENHLQMLVRQKVIATWSSGQVGAGQDWRQVVAAHLDSASVILLLLTAAYFASDHCYDVEVETALSRARSAKAHVVPIRVRAYDWGAVPFEHLRALPANGMPITSWSNHDEAWAQVAAEIRRLVMGIAPTEPCQSTTPDLRGPTPPTAAPERALQATLRRGVAWSADTAAVLAVGIHAEARSGGVVTIHFDVALQPFYLGPHLVTIDCCFACTSALVECSAERARLTSWTEQLRAAGSGTSDHGASGAQPGALVSRAVSGGIELVDDARVGPEVHLTATRIGRSVVRWTIAHRAGHATRDFLEGNVMLGAAFAPSTTTAEKVRCWVRPTGVRLFGPDRRVLGALGSLALRIKLFAQGAKVPGAEHVEHHVDLPR